MQQAVPRPQPSPNTSPTNSRKGPSPVVLVLALLLFALSGLMTGFATGTFTRPKQSHQQVNPHQQTAPPTAVVQKSTPHTTPTVQVLKLGLPIIQQMSYIERPDETTSYTVAAYPIDQIQGSQVHVADITCKIWLTKDEHATDTLLASQDKLQKIEDVPGTLPTEIENALVFGGTPQTKFCNADGPTTWTYTIAQTVDPGKYFLMVLADWKGLTYNWTARQITIKKAD